MAPATLPHLHPQVHTTLDSITLCIGQVEGDVAGGRGLAGASAIKTEDTMSDDAGVASRKRAKDAEGAFVDTSSMMPKKKLRQEPPCPGEHDIPFDQSPASSAGGAGAIAFSGRKSTILDYIKKEDIEQEDVFQIPVDGSLMVKSIDLVQQLQTQLERCRDVMLSDAEEGEHVPQSSARKTLVDATQSFQTQLKDERNGKGLSVVLLGISGDGKSTLINWAVQVCLRLQKMRPRDVMYTCTCMQPQEIRITCRSMNRVWFVDQHVMSLCVHVRARMTSVMQRGGGELM